MIHATFTDRALLQLHVDRAIAIAAVGRARLVGSTGNIKAAIAAAHAATHALMKYEGARK